MSNEGMNTPREQRPEERLIPKEFFKDFFGLQYSAAKTMGERLHIPLGEALFTYTMFFRRFGLVGDESNHEWVKYLEGLASHTDDPISYTYDFYKQLQKQAPKTAEQRYGCFGFDPADENGIIKIHFRNEDRDSTSPLSIEKIEKRKQELKTMFTHIKQTYPNATAVQGGSWLYNLETYRRLFPPSFGDSRRPFELSRRTRGMHYWGQFIDHKGQIKPGLGEKLLDNLKDVDEDHVGASFPLQPLLTEAPIQDFYKFYGIE